MNFDRRVTLYIAPDGTIVYHGGPHESLLRRQKGDSRPLPFTSVDSLQDAEDLVVLLCKLQYGEHPLVPGKPWRAFRPTGAESGDMIAQASRAFETAYEQMLDRRREASEEATSSPLTP